MSSSKKAPPSGGSSRYRTPPPRSPCTDLDSSYGFFNPNPGPDPLYDGKEINFNPDGSPSNIQYNYTRHGRQYSWDWHNPMTRQNPTIEEGWRPWGHPDLDNSIFEEFLQCSNQSSQASPTPASRQQPSEGERVLPLSQNSRSPSASGGGIPSGPTETAQEGPRRSGRAHQPRQQLDNVYSSMETTQVESLTDHLWERFLGDSQNPQGPPRAVHSWQE